MAEISDAIASATEAATKEYNESTGNQGAIDSQERRAEKQMADDNQLAEETDPERDAKPEPAKAEKAPEADNPMNLSKEDLEAIESDPLLRKAYKTQLRGFNAKMQELAAKNKAFEEDQKVLQWFRQDPDNALKAIARMRGFDLGEPKGEAAKTVDKIEDVMVKTFGPEGAKTLRPVLETIVQTLVDEKIKPQANELQQLREAAVETGIENVLQTFIAEKHANDEEYDDEIQNEMSVLAQKVRKADDVPLKDHIQNLYATVMYNRVQKTKVSEDLRRLQAARKKTEPVQGTRPTTVERKISDGKTLNEKIAMAVGMAREDLG